MSFLDRSADPCSDFYQFACGTWINEHPVGEYPAWSRFHEAHWRNRRLVRAIVEEEAPVTTLPAVVNFYQSCLDAARRMPDRALDEQLQLIANLQGLAALPAVLGALHKAGVRALFAAWPFADPGEPSRFVATVYPAGLTLPGREYYLDPAFAIRAEFEAHVSELVRVYASQAVTVDPTAVAELETHLAEALPDNGVPRDPPSYYHLLPLAELEAEVPSFDWEAYFTALGAGSVAVANVTNLDYLAALEAELTSAPLAALKSYLAFRTIESHALALGQSASREETRFHDGVIYGDSSPREDWSLCLDATIDTFSAELAKPFAAYRSNAKDRAVVTGMAEGVVNALRASLDEASWLDPSTRDAAQAKLSAMQLHIAFPDGADWPVSTFPPTNVTYLAARIGWSRAAAARAWSEAREPVNRSEWSSSIMEANAWYSPLTNQVTLPAGILQIPHFDAGWRSVMNYGSLASLLGHEITHGFDNSGRWYDAEGRLGDWWSEASAGAYRERAECLVNEYDAFEVKPGLTLDGQATLGENIADLGGLKLAYAAYQASGAGDGADGGFSVEQQFFLAYAQIWCANYSDEFSEYLTLTDPHALPRFRVNGVVRNMPEFERAFTCPASAPLASADRCSIF